MSVAIAISEGVAQHLSTLVLGDTDNIDQKLVLLLEAEYRRRLARYSLIDRQMSQKYAMSFEAFEQQRVTEQQNYSWDVESDAMAWETALDGIQTIQRKLVEIENILLENELI